MDEEEESGDFTIVRTKRFSIKPMTPQEAILQMNLLEHEFYAFLNSEDADGNTITRNGVPNTNALAEFGHAAQIDSYSIYYNGRLLMTVTPVGFSAPDTAVMSIGGMPACSGFYKTTFSVDETREIFLTGLTESTLEQVQNELTASALEDRYEIPRKSEAKRS